MIKSFILLLTFLLSIPSFARTGVTIHVTGGQIISPTFDQDTSLTASGVTTKTNASSSDSGSTFFGGDLTVQTPFMFGVALAVETFDYKYGDGSPSDSETILMAIPRFELSLPLIDLWAGVGIGTMSTKIGQTDLKSSTYQFTLPDSATGTVISPRIGADIYFWGDWSVGVQLAYTMTSGESIDFTGKTVPGNVAVTGHSTIKRSWTSAGLRLGYNLF